jgi:hypothetical protein
LALSLGDKASKLTIAGYKISKNSSLSFQKNRHLSRIGISEPYTLFDLPMKKGDSINFLVNGDYNYVVLVLNSNLQIEDLTCKSSKYITFQNGKFKGCTQLNGDIVELQ